MFDSDRITALRQSYFKSFIENCRPLSGAPNLFTKFICLRSANASNLSANNSHFKTQNGRPRRKSAIIAGCSKNQLPGTNNEFPDLNGI
jgi:hypothetical protein